MRRLGCVCLLLLITGCMRLDWFKRSEPPPLPLGLPIGSPAPELAGIDFDGKPLDLKEYRGKVVVVSFWTSWCGPCKAMIPHERALVERFGDRLVLLGVNNDDNHEAARGVIASHGITWPCLQTAGVHDPINHRWAVTFYPTIYVLDGHGDIRYANVRGPALENAITSLLAEKK